MPQFAIHSDTLRAVLAPEVGGSIARFDRRYREAWRPVLRGCEGVLASPLEGGCFPLVPFCNRIRGGRFSFSDETISLAANLPGDPSPIHGQGWQRPWHVVDHGPAHAQLLFEHVSGAWPWHYEARQHFRLDSALHVTLSCRNLSDRPMPCGLGFHPYFPCRAGTRISTQVREVWTVDADVLPVERVPATGRYTLRDASACARGLDNGYGGWSGRAEIRDAGTTDVVCLSSDTARFFQFYSPPSGDLFVAEPVSHANDALNHPREAWDALGLTVLPPRARAQLDMQIAFVRAG